MQKKLSITWFLGAAIMLLMALTIIFISIWRQIDAQVEESLIGSSGGERILVASSGSQLRTTISHDPLPELTYLPHHPLYFVRMIWQRVKLWTTFGELEKAEVLEKYADERMGVARQLLQKGLGSEAIEAAAKGYMYDLEAAGMLRLYQTEEARILWRHLAGATEVHEQVVINIEAAVADDFKPKVGLIADGLERLRKEAEAKSGKTGSN